MEFKQKAKTNSHNYADQVAVRLGTKLADEVRQIAADNNTTISEVVRKFCEVGYAKYQKTKETN